MTDDSVVDECEQRESGSSHQPSLEQRVSWNLPQDVYDDTDQDDNRLNTKKEFSVPSTPTTTTQANDDNAHNYSRDSGGNSLRRSVTWADGTAAPKEVEIAISIPRFKKLKAGYHVYSISVWQEGRAWQVRRRYREFLAFHQNVAEEELIKADLLPTLPPKHIFHMRHFSKRAEDKFLFQRKYALQEYIRQILKIEKIVERSFSLQEFLEINKTRLNSGLKPSKNKKKHQKDDLEDLCNLYHQK